MALPRLAPAVNAYTLSNVVINERLRPYFEVWYQSEKQLAETPQEFALRILKVAAQDFHVNANIRAEQDAIEQAKIDKATEVQADINAFNSETD